MTNLMISSQDEPRTTKPRCGTCERAIAPGTSSVAFPAHHSKCIDRSLARARAADTSWD